jgi:methionyl-tRNA formyltransferase
MKIALLALTGFGNEILQALIRNRAADDIIVFTREETGTFPYYECEYLADVCKREGLRVLTSLGIQEIEGHLSGFAPDLILVATFDLRIPSDILELPQHGVVNVHPSLLPAYRGPTPTNWAIIHNERVSGVSFQKMNEAWDMGDIVFQREAPIAEMTDGELREKLARMAGEMLHDFIPKYLAADCDVIPQCPNEGSYYPKITSKEGVALLKTGRFDRNNLIRGLTPFPGIEILE